MIITNKCKIENKIMIFSELTRIDEALATLIENYHDIDEVTRGAIDTLDFMGFKLELKINPEYVYADPVFDELNYIRDELINEINNCDFKIHYNKKYGWDNNNAEYYKESEMVIL